MRARFPSPAPTESPRSTTATSSAQPGPNTSPRLPASGRIVADDQPNCGWWPCPSRVALRLAADGRVHLAGTHLSRLDDEYNTGPGAGLLPQGGEVIGFSSWREGLVLRPALADGIRG